MLQPLFDRVLIQKIEENNVTSSGVYIPDSGKEKPDRAVVIATGKDVAVVEKGDTVLFNRWSGQELVADGKELLAITEKDIIAIVR